MKEIEVKSILVCISKGLSYQEAITIVLKLSEKLVVSHKITFSFFCFLTRQPHGMMIITGKWRQITLKETENSRGPE